MMKFLQFTLSLCVLGVGIYMFNAFEHNTPPSISGIGFILAGLGMFLHNFVHHH